MEPSPNWIIIIRGEAEGEEVRVALDFQDTEPIFSPSRFIVGTAFIDQLLEMIRLHENWVIKTVIEEIYTPQDTHLPGNIPIFILLTKSHPRGLSAGALFLAEETAYLLMNETPQKAEELSGSVFEAAKRFSVVGVTPIGFAAACKEDPRLFTRFITRLLKRPEAFTDVSLLLPRQIQK